MEKNNLVKKILNYALPIALTIGSAFYSNNANAQKTAIDINEATTAKVSAVNLKKAINLKYVPAFVMPSSEQEKNEAEKPPINFYPKQTTIARGNELYGILNYTLNKAKVNEKDVDYVKYKGTEDEQKKLESLIQKEGESGQVLKIDVSKAKELPYTIIETQNQGSFFYFPIDEKTDSLVKTGKRLGIVIPVDKSEIALDFRNREDPILIGNPNNVYYIDLKETDVLDQILYKEEKGKLDSLGTKYLADEKAKEIWEANPKNSKDVYKFIDLPFLTEKPLCGGEGQKPCDEKSPSKINGRIKAGIGVTAPIGFEASLNPQLQIGEKTFLGPYASFSNSSSSLENITKEDGFRQVVSVPAQMYFVNTGSEIKENTKVTNNFGFGLNFSYVAPSWEAFIKAGLLGQKTEKTMTSTGEEYMEIAGAKEDVQAYNETNNFTFKGSPVYVGAGAEYFPLKGKKILENISVAGEIGYVFGENSGALGSLGIKYTLEKSKDKDKSEK